MEPQIVHPTSLQDVLSIYMKVHSNFKPIERSIPMFSFNACNELLNRNCTLQLISCKNQRVRKQPFAFQNDNSQNKNTLECGETDRVITKIIQRLTELLQLPYEPQIQQTHSVIFTQRLCNLGCFIRIYCYSFEPSAYWR